MTETLFPKTESLTTTECSRTIYLSIVHGEVMGHVFAESDRNRLYRLDKAARRLAVLDRVDPDTEAYGEHTALPHIVSMRGDGAFEIDRVLAVVNDITVNGHRLVDDLAWVLKNAWVLAQALDEHAALKRMVEEYHAAAKAPAKKVAG